MPQLPLNLTPDDQPLQGLQITIHDNIYEFEDSIIVECSVRHLDGSWSSAGNLHLYGFGRDFLASAVEDIVYAWHFEDRRAMLREQKRNQREANEHHRRHERRGETRPPLKR